MWNQIKMKNLIQIIFLFVIYDSNGQNITMSEFDEFILNDTTITLQYENRIIEPSYFKKEESVTSINSDKSSRRYASQQVELINSLIDKGNTSEALLKFEQTLIDYKSGVQKHIRFGRFKDKTNIICNLYQNGDEAIKDDVTRLAAELLSNKLLEKDAEVVYPLLLIQPKITKKALIEDFRLANSSTTIDFTDRRNRSKYCSDLYLYAPIIAPTIGIEFWNAYIDRKEYFNDYNAPFDLYSVTFAYYCNQNDNLTVDQKALILRYISQNNSYVNKRSNWFYDYNSLINFYFPDLPNEEIAQFIPERYINDPYQKSFKIPQLDKLPNYEDFIEEIGKSFGELSDLNINDECFFRYTNGFYTINNLKQNLSHLFSHFLQSSDSYIILSPDYGFVPVLHDKYFTENILPKLNTTFASLNFRLNQRVEQKDGEFHYTISIGNKNGTYSFEYESLSDYYNYSPIIKALNLLLIKEEVTKRLVNIDQAVIICDPRNAKQTFEKYNLQASPINPSDQWIKK